MATVGITISLKVYGGVTVKEYVQNTLAIHELGADDFAVELLRTGFERPGWDGTGIRHASGSRRWARARAGAR